MENHSNRTPRTILALPNHGRSSVWTGRTVSGQTIHSVVAIPNRTVQLHFHCDEQIPPYTKSFENTQFERLCTFWYEFPMRHYGIQIDDMTNPDPIVGQDPLNVPNVAPFPNMRQGLQNGGPVPMLRPRRLFSPQRPVINHLRFSHAPTIGRETVHGCPKIGNDLALSSLQVKSVLYTHHKSGTVDVLIIKLFIEPADTEFDDDHTNYYIRSRIFPGFNFDQPMSLRNRFNMGNSTFISRNSIIP